MAWLFRDKAIDYETILEIERQADRGAAIIACAYLEEFLVTAITSLLVDDKNGIEKMFTGMGPLATFSAKIEIAYLLKVITQDAAQDMHKIRKIRNDFAHNLRTLTFDTPYIKDRCKTLLQRDQLRVVWEQLMTSVGHISEARDVVDKLLMPMMTLPDTPRNAYLNSIKFLIFYLGVDTLRRNLLSALQSHHQQVIE